MSSSRDITIVKIELDFCTHRFGLGGCSASAPPGEECYGTLATCPVPQDFDKGTRAYYFTTPGAPVVENLTMFRQLTGEPRVSPGRLNKLKGLGGRDAVIVPIADFPHDDTWVDPYRAGRSPPRSSFFQKLRARNRYFPRRPMTIMRGKVPPSGIVDLETFSTQTYLLFDLLPDGGGIYAASAKDPLGISGEKRLVPATTTGELAADIDDAVLVFDLKPGHAAQYGAAPFILAIDKEDVEVTNVVGDTLTVTREVNGTTAADHKADTRCQKVKVYAPARPDDRVEELLADAGVSGAYFDKAAATIEVDRWQAAWDETGCVVRTPTDALQLLQDYLIQVFAVLAWDPSLQVYRYRHNRPFDLDEVPTTLTDGVIRQGSLRENPDPRERINDVTIFFAVEDWSRSVTNQDKDTPAFTQVVSTSDGDAQDALQYGDELTLVVHAYWIPKSMAFEMRSMAFRILSQYRDMPEPISLEVPRVPGEDLSILAPVRIQSREYVGADGRPKTVEGVVLKYQPPRDLEFSVFGLEVDQQNFRRRWGFYAPLGLPDYVAASASQRRYSFYARPDGRQPNEDEGYSYL